MTDERRVRDIGEFGLIAELEAALPGPVRANERVDVGIGDDAAIWRPSDGLSSVITTDTLIEGNHFRLDWTDWRSLGHKMLAVNLSDVAAMGATAVLATVTLGLSGDERLADLLELYRGVGELAGPHEVIVAGGDIVRTSGPLMISVTAIGEGERLLTRAGARPGDRIMVSGTLGASAAGLRLLADPELRAKATTADLLVAAHLRPNPRLALGRFLAGAGATAAMDLSDGLLGDLPKLLQASGARAAIDARSVPVLPALRALFPGTWLDLALRGGEDYELLATVPNDLVEGITREAAAIGATLTGIGEILPPDDGQPLLTLRDLDGTEHPVAAGAFDHFG
ncbi:MAG TPA: thiamine-phosphate kinase [Thermomicrobiales bacterium]|nr:thiamine-phosphate kinase [Thermomicrobiales bacterium]